MLLFLSSIYTEEERLEAFFNPDQYMLSDNFVDKNKDSVLLFCLLKGVSYPTEISRDLQLNVETINKILSKLIKEGYAKRIRPLKFQPQPMFFYRIPEFQENGLDSFDKVSKCSWIIPTPIGVQLIKDKYAGQQKQIHKSLVEYYNFKVLEEI